MDIQSAVQELHEQLKDAQGSTANVKDFQFDFISNGGVLTLNSKAENIAEYSSFTDGKSVKINFASSVQYPTVVAVGATRRWNSSTNLQEEKLWLVSFYFEDISNSGFELNSLSASSSESESHFALISPSVGSSSGGRIESVQGLFMNHLEGYAKAFYDGLANAFGDDDGSESEKGEE